jgi:hypothetical protein
MLGPGHRRRPWALVPTRHSGGELELVERLADNVDAETGTPQEGRNVAMDDSREALRARNDDDRNLLAGRHRREVSLGVDVASYAAATAAMRPFRDRRPQRSTAVRTSPR